jgi:DNA-binding transcriptional LysR family regulator
MINSFKMFLLLAEELNFGKAAKRAFVTQQCLSDHIKRLEMVYNTRLFERKPKIKLTGSGEIMLQTLQQISLLEQNMEKIIFQLENGILGNLRIGINQSRMQVLLPNVFPVFHDMFPNVKLTISFNDTKIMEEKLLRGELDVFLGVNASTNPMFNVMPLSQESLYIVISDATMRKLFKNEYPSCLVRFQQGISLKDFSDIPIIQRDSPSTLTDVTNDYCCRNSINLNSILSINDFDTQLQLCFNMEIMTVFPSMFICKVIEHNDKHSQDEKLHVFPILTLNGVMRLDLISYRIIQLPIYATKLYELLRAECEKFSYL